MTSACPTVSATGCSDLGRFSAASNTRGGGVSSHPEAVPDAVRSGRSPRSRKPVVAVTGAASGLGAARRGPAGGQPGGRQGRRPRRPPRQTDGRHLAGARHPGPGAGDPAREGRHRGPPGAGHRPRRRPPGSRARSTSAAPRPCSPRRPRPAYAGSCSARRRWSTAPLADNECRCPRTRRCARCPTAALRRRLLEIERLAAQAPRSHPGLQVTVLRPAAVVGPGVDSLLTRHFEAPRLLVVRGLDAALAVLPRRRPRGRAASSRRSAG